MADTGSLSEKGTDIYKSNGFYEVDISFHHTEFDEEEGPWVLTMDFVLDDDLTAKFENFDLEERYQFLTKNRIKELSENGYIIDVYSFSSSPISSVSELEDELTDIIVFSD